MTGLLVARKTSRSNGSLARLTWIGMVVQRFRTLAPAPAIRYRMGTANRPSSPRPARK